MGKQFTPSSFEELKTFEPIDIAPSSFEELKTFEEIQSNGMSDADWNTFDQLYKKKNPDKTEVFDTSGIEPSQIIGTGSVVTAQAPTAEERYRSIPQTSASYESPESIRKREWLTEFANTRGGNVPFLNPIETIGTVNNLTGMAEGAVNTGKNLAKGEFVDAGISAAHTFFAGIMATPMAVPFNVGLKGLETASPEATKVLMQPVSFGIDEAIKAKLEETLKRNPTQEEFEESKKIVEKLPLPNAKFITGKQAMEIGDIVGNYALFAGFHKATKLPSEISRNIENRSNQAISEIPTARQPEGIVSPEQMKEGERFFNGEPLPINQIPNIEGRTPLPDPNILDVIPISETQRNAQGILRPSEKIPFESKVSSIVDKQGKPFENIPDPMVEKLGQSPKSFEEIPIEEVRSEPVQEKPLENVEQPIDKNKIAQKIYSTLDDLNRGRQAGNADRRVELNQIKNQSGLNVNNNGEVVDIETGKVIKREIAKPTDKVDDRITSEQLSEREKAIIQDAGEHLDTGNSKATNRAAQKDIAEDGGKELSQRAQDLISVAKQADQSGMTDVNIRSAGIKDAIPTDELLLSKRIREATTVDELSKITNEIKDARIPNENKINLTDAIDARQVELQPKDAKLDLTGEGNQSNMFAGQNDPAYQAKAPTKGIQSDKNIGTEGGPLFESAKPKIENQENIFEQPKNIGNKQVGKIFDKLISDKIGTEDYSIHGLLADWGNARYDKYTEKLYFEDTRSSTGKWSLSKKGFIDFILSDDATKMSKDAEYQSALKDAREIISGELKEGGKEPKGNNEGRNALLSIGGNVVANSIIQNSNLDDNTKKKLSIVVNALALAGVVGVVSMSKEAKSFLAEIRSGVIKKAMLNKWDATRIENEVRKSTNEALQGEDAKGFSSKDIEAIRQANNTADFKSESVKTSNEIKSSFPEPKTKIEKAVQDVQNPELLNSDKNVNKVSEAINGVKNYFDNVVEIGKDVGNKRESIAKNFARIFVRSTTEAAVSPDFKKVYDVVGDHERSSNARLNDIETAIKESKKNLTLSEMDRVAKLRYQENLQEGIYTNLELSKKGYSDKEISSINSLRKAQSDVLNISRDLRLKEWGDYLKQLEEKAQSERWKESEEKPSKEIVAIEKEISNTKNTVREIENYYETLKDQGYLTLKRRGKFVVAAKDSNGELQYDHAIDRQGQQNIKKRFKKLGFKDVELYENKKFYSQFRDKLSPSELEILMDDAGVDPYSTEGMKILTEAKKKFATKSYELPRKYTPGYEQTMDNLVRGLTNQGEAFNNLYFRKIGREDSMGALANAQIEKSKPELYAYTRDYIEQSFSSPESNFKGLHAAKKLTYLMQLGLDPMQFIFNGVFQPLMVTRPYFSRPEFGLKGSEVNTYFAKGISSAKQLLKGEAPKEMQDFYKRAVNEGVATEVLSKEVADIEAKEIGTLAKIASNSSYFTKKGEQWTRSQTIAEAYLIGKEKMNLKGDELYRYIVDAVNNTQGKAGRGEMPDIFRRFGEVGRAAYQFNSYVNLYLENAALSIRSDVKAGKMSLPTFRKLIVTLGVVGGMNAFPASGLAQALYVKLTGRDPEQDLKNNIGEIPSKFLMYGITGNSSFSGRIGMLNRLPDNNKQGSTVTNLITNSIPAVNQANQLVSAAENIGKGRILEGGSAFAPKGLRNIIKSTQMAKDGIKVKEGVGEKTLKRPSQINILDYVKQGVGLTPEEKVNYYRKRSLGLNRKRGFTY